MKIEDLLNEQNMYWGGTNNNGGGGYFYCLF